MQLIIDSGHQLDLPGARGEAERTIAIKNALRAYVDFVDVPDNGELINQIKWINGQGFSANDILLSIHCNAGGGDGIETWYYGGSETSATKAKQFNDIVCQITGENNRGVHPDTSNRWGRLAIIRDTKPWAFLIEAGFVDSSDGDDMTKPADLYAKGISKALHDVFGVPLKGQSVPQPTQPKPAPKPVYKTYTLIKNMNVRTQPKVDNNLFYYLRKGKRTCILYRGDKTDIVRFVVGQSVNGNNKWGQTTAGRYIHSSGLK
jgi:hypothetical protein